MAVVQSNSLYVYCINNPLKYVDPWGLNADSVYTLLRAMVDMYDGNIDVGYDRVTVHLNNRSSEYYYNTSKNGSKHGNYMKGQKMYVDAVKFGNFFGLNKHTRKSAKEGGYLFVGGEYDSALSGVTIGGINVQWTFYLSWIVTPDKVIVYNQSYSVTSYDWTGTPGVMDPPTLTVSKSVGFYNTAGQMIKSTSLVNYTGDEMFSPNFVERYHLVSGEGKYTVIDRQTLQAKVGYTLTMPGSINSYYKEISISIPFSR